MRKKSIRIVGWGGWGDLMLNTPALAALKKRDKDVRITVYLGSRSRKELFINNPNVDRMIYCSRLYRRFLDLFVRLNWIKLYVPNYGRLLPGLFYSRRAVEIIASEIFNVELEDKKIQLYLSDQEDKKAKAMLAGYKKPVVIHITSIASPNHMWPLENWEALINSLPEVTFIQVGLLAEDKVNGAVDLRGKTSFREAIGVIKHSKSFVGVNSSFSHATNAFDIPGVVLFGSSPPEIWGHPNNINLYKKLRCSPCIDIIGNTKCPYSRPCMTGITVEDVKAALTKQLA